MELKLKMGEAQFSRLPKDEGGNWCLVANPGQQEGDAVKVTKRNGKTVGAVLGAPIKESPRYPGYWLFALDETTKAPTAGDGEDEAQERPKTTAGGLFDQAGIGGNGTAKPAQTSASDVQRAVEVLRDVLGGGGGATVDPDQVREIVRTELENGAGRLVIDVRQHDDKPLKRLEGTQHEMFARALTWAAHGVHVMLTGPAGSGKTTLAMQVGEALGRKAYLTGAILTKHEVTGYTDASGRYVRTASRDAYEYGGVLVLDEVDGSLPPALVAENGMLANGQFTFPDGVVKRHPDFVVVACANTWGKGADRQYVGRYQLDGATLDRFIKLEIGYDEKLEAAIARAEFEAHGGTDTAKLDEWLRTVLAIRRKIAAKGLREIVSPRASIHGARGLAAGLSASDVLLDCITASMSADTRQQLGVAS